MSETSFYKHIDADLPEPQRAKQLMIWCASRASLSSSPSTKNKSKATSKKNPLPPLNDEETGVFKAVKDDVIKLLAEGRVDTNVYSLSGSEGWGSNGKGPRWAKENEQNRMNREREVRFGKDMERRVFFWSFQF